VLQALAHFLATSVLANPYSGFAVEAKTVPFARAH
jgi:hypothetical protein